MQELLYDAIIINEGTRTYGWILIDSAGIIAEIGAGDAPHELLAREDVVARDMQRHWLLPGVIDSHVHFREPGMKHKATIYSESRAAAVGGVTSIMDMPNTSPATVTLEGLDEKYYRAERDSAVNYAFFLGANSSNITTLQRADYTRVPGVKVFMGSSTGGMLVDDVDVLRAIFKLPALVMAHCEQEDIISFNLNRLKTLFPNGGAPAIWHPQIRSELACYASSKRAVELARKYGTRLHVAHITTAEELSLFSAEEPDITAEVCVPHLLFSDEDYATLGTRIKCNPAIKGERHRRALREAVASGLVRTVSTDHAPHTLEEKMQDQFLAPSGMPMVQFSLLAMLELAHSGYWSVERVVDVMSHSQASLFKVCKRGFLRAGYYADIVEIDPEATTLVTPEIIQSKCGWSPLEGRELWGKIITTRVNGKCVYCHMAPEATGLEKSAMPLRFEV